MFTRKYVGKSCLSLLLLLPIGGCDEIRSYIDQGSTVAFQRCVERAGAKPLNEFTVRATCIKENQHDAKIEIWGSGSYFSEYLTNKYGFKVSIVNKSEDYVLTSIRVYLVRKDKSETQSHLMQNMWIEPGMSRDYTFQAEDIIKQPSDVGLKEDGGWNVSDIKGIKIKI